MKSGAEGHHLDLRLVRNQWLLIDPGAECLMSEANEDKTIGDIREMGGRLAEEVTAFLRKKMDKASKSGGYRNIKLSFVGHAIGNIIIRSALTGWLCSLSSARIELCPASSWDYSKKGHVSTDMINNCLDQIRAPSDRRTFMCFDVNFDTSSQSRSFNTIIGRA